MFKAGSADAFLGVGSSGLRRATEGEETAGPTGAGLLRRAREHIGEKYVNVLVPKDDPNWKGPWDCAEFMSWLVYQEARILYGCEDDKAKPSKAEAYTGAWQEDVERLGIRVSVDTAVATVGGIVLRYPPAPGAMGHIALCDGNGGTVEAKGKASGVVADTVHGRRWDTGVLIPGINYILGDGISARPPALIYRRNAPNMDKAVILRNSTGIGIKGLWSGGNRRRVRAGDGGRRSGFPAVQRSGGGWRGGARHGRRLGSFPDRCGQPGREGRRASALVGRPKEPAQGRNLMEKLGREIER